LSESLAGVGINWFSIHFGQGFVQCENSATGIEQRGPDLGVSKVVVKSLNKCVGIERAV
jgi:hypothetical protein